MGEQGISQAALASAIGIRQQTVSKWLKGEVAPPVPRLVEIEQALGMPPATLTSEVLGQKVRTMKRAKGRQLGIAERVERLERKVARLETRDDRAGQ